MRNQATGLWTTLPIPEQRRFLRHAYRHWDVHRHRMAPLTGALVNDLVASGRLIVRAGDVARVNRVRAGIRAEIVAGRNAPERLGVAAIVNCTGPSGEVGNGAALLQHLLRRGMIRPHPIGIGIAVIARGNPIAADGSVDDRIHTIGFLRRGSLLESTAIPELRRQAENIASWIAHEHPELFAPTGALAATG